MVKREFRSIDKISIIIENHLEFRISLSSHQQKKNQKIWHEQKTLLTLLF